MEQVILNYLQVLDIPVSKTYFRKQVASHPEYPSILSVADTLERFGIKHAVARVPKEDLEKLPFPFVLHLKRGQGQFLLLQNQQELEEHQSDLEDWDGVILLAEESEVTFDKEHREVLSREKTSKAGMILLGLSAMLFFGIMLFQNFTWYYLLLLATSFAGTVLGILLTAKDVGIRYEVVESFCNAGQNINCDQVLISDEATLFGGFKLSDAVLSYFTFQLIVTGIWLPAGNEASPILSVLSVFTMLSIPVVGYSLYLQGVKLKSWCRFCLLVGAVFLVQAALFGWMYATNIFVLSDAGFWPVTQTVLLLAAISSLEFLLKSSVQEGSRAAEAEIAANRMIYSPEVFTYLLGKEKRVNTSPFEKELRIGKPDTPIQIMMAASLSCSPCKDGFEKLTDLIQAFPDQIHAVVRFRIDITKKGKETEAEQPLLNYWLANIHCANDASPKTMKLIMDWYERINPQRFVEKYPVDHNHNGIDKELNHMEEQLSGWFREEKIHSTPSYFINGYQLPRHYKIDDLKKLIPELVEYSKVKDKSSELSKRMFGAAE